MNQILYISEADLLHPAVVPFIHGQQDQEDYWNDDWSASLYTRLAYEGLISITIPDPENNRQVLLSQMQKAYALLDWENLHLSGHVRRLLRPSDAGRFQLRISSDLMPVIGKLQAYHEQCWLTDEYAALLCRIQDGGDRRCRPLAVELLVNGELAAGEIAYTTGAVFTSLSGFSSRMEGMANLGTLQLVLLGTLLEKKGFAFWNLGHPYMEYKTRLGAEIVGRPDFLGRWMRVRDGEAEPVEGLFRLHELSPLQS